MGETLETEGGSTVPELALHPSQFIDRTTVLYGPSQTGKTVFIKNILKLVKGHIEQVLVVSPTEPSNHSYDGFIDPALIHYQINLPDPRDKKDTEAKAKLRFLQTIYSRQEMMASIYGRANDVAMLSRLYARISHAGRKEGDRYIASLERKRRRANESMRRQYGGDPGLLAEKSKEAEEKFTKLLVLLYKKFLTPNVDDIWAKKDLSEEERFSLHYLHFNPRLLLIFDDCAAELKAFFNKEIFRKLFYQNRHSYISVIVSCQDDTDLPTNLRKNAFVSVFTDPVVATSNFTRGSNNFPKKTKVYAEDIIPAVFVGHRKLVYIREDEKRQHFYHTTCARTPPFRFGSDALLDLCDSVRSTEAAMDEANPFYSKFRV